LKHGRKGETYNEGYSSQAETAERKLTSEGNAGWVRSLGEGTAVKRRKRRQLRPCGEIG